MEITDDTKFTGELTITIRDGKTGHIKSKDIYRNMFVTAGKNSVAQGFAGVTSNNQGIPTYCALGTSSVAPAPTDTTLTAEVFRKMISASSATGNVATFQTYFNTTDVNGTLREAGLFGDIATAAANSGTLFCKASINRTKTVNDTLTLSWAVTIG